jgi:hypothetical protein
MSGGLLALDCLESLVQGDRSRGWLGVYSPFPYELDWIHYYLAQRKQAAVLSECTGCA